MKQQSMKTLMTELLDKLKLVRDLMHESDGVAGYYSDGKVMPWNEWEDLNPEALTSLIDKVDSQIDGITTNH